MDTFSYFTRPDLTYNNYYKPSPVELIYNTILIPIDKYPDLENYEISNKVTIKNGRTKGIFEQSVVFDNGIIELNNTKYRYFYIAPGIRINNKNLEKQDFVLSINNQEINLNLLFTNPNAKLLIGILVLSNNYYYYFDNNDIGILYINNKKIKCNLVSKINKYNYYMSRRINTIINIMDNKNLDIFYELNNSIIITSAKIQSQIITKSSNKGQIALNKLSKSNIPHSVKCIGVDNNFKNEYNMSGRRLYINNLSKGKYRLDISNNLGESQSVFVEIDYFIDRTSTKCSLPHYKNSILNIP